MADIELNDSPFGYRRDDELQRRFTDAADTLRRLDGWSGPAGTDEPQLRADLVLEGGGVKGIALVAAVLVLGEAGYRFNRVAGTSAGAIAAAVIAGIERAGRPISDLLGYYRTLDFDEFMPDGRVHEFLERAGGHVGELVADAAILSGREGIYSGDYLARWLTPILHDELGVRTFGDLKMDPVADPGASIDTGQDYRLVVFTSDISRGRLARLPWDYPLYGCNPDEMDPVAAVRASMSIPLFFEPVRFVSCDATVEVARPGGGRTAIHYPAGVHTWVDGALLAKFPIHSFERVDGAAPRWPTLGVKLSRLETEEPAADPSQSALEVAVRCLKTMMNEWDSYAEHHSVVARTIHVDNAGLNATDFDLRVEDRNTLFLNGVRAATQFVLDAAANGGVPRG